MPHNWVSMLIGYNTTNQKLDPKWKQKPNFTKSTQVSSWNFKLLKVWWHFWFMGLGSISEQLWKSKIWKQLICDSWMIYESLLIPLRIYFTTQHSQYVVLRLKHVDIGLKFKIQNS